MLTTPRRKDVCPLAHFVSPLTLLVNRFRQWQACPSLYMCEYMCMHCWCFFMLQCAKVFHDPLHLWTLSTYDCLSPLHLVAPCIVKFQWMDVSKNCCVEPMVPNHAFDGEGTRPSHFLSSLPNSELEVIFPLSIRASPYHSWSRGLHSF